MSKGGNIAAPLVINPNSAPAQLAARRPLCSIGHWSALAHIKTILHKCKAAPDHRARKYTYTCCERAGSSPSTSAIYKQHT
jgi:hypothetical protein